MTPIEDSRSDPQILSTKRPLHFWSSIGVSISEAPKAEFSNVCSEIVTFSENWRVYLTKSLLFFENPLILMLAPQESVIWPSNSLEETIPQFRILERGEDFWSPKCRIFKCMQRKRNFFTEITNAYKKSIHKLYQGFADPQIPSTKRPLSYASSIGVSISEAPKAEFSNGCNKNVTLSHNGRMYHRKLILLTKFGQR